jgi:hypothetical protein
MGGSCDKLLVDLATYDIGVGSRPPLGHEANMGHQGAQTPCLKYVRFAYNYAYPRVYMPKIHIPNSYIPKICIPKYIYPGYTYLIYTYPDYVYIRIFYILKVYMPKKHHT